MNAGISLETRQLQTQQTGVFRHSTQVEIQVIAVRVHVPGKYYIVHTIRVHIRIHAYIICISTLSTYYQV